MVTPTLLLALAASASALNPLRSVRNLFKPSRAAVAAPEGAEDQPRDRRLRLLEPGMGWFHGLQLVEGECPSGKLSDIVEPWFLGGGKDSDAGKQFAAEASTAGRRTPPSRRWTGAAGLSTSTWSGAAPGEPKLALIAGRTVDNPGFFQQALDSARRDILLEKPGAPTVGELESMAATAEKADVPVFMGFIKNIAPYFTQALDAYGKHPPAPGSLVTLTSLNDYTEESLGECFERNAEGMLKNMAIHELALAATFFGMTADSIADAAVAGNCDCRTIGSYTDFAKIDFTLTNKAGGKLRIVADRCGGDDGCFGVRRRRLEVVFEAEMVDADRAARVAARQAEHPDWIGYLITQEDEYKDLKERCAAAALAGTFPAASRTSASPSTRSSSRSTSRPCSRRSS
ncbi:hypothetical protein SO694_00015348 [Aureococcus anophagefferens]|uniref:Gfo/Idh/MocA-like oxidoreductase N-terminal domain-containing protein n=1 Tax=Aureococcus anophagefferens TaxID=44056 RepID=A0ABR1G2I5_AURAN